jgi:hypothetical protein
MRNCPRTATISNRIEGIQSCQKARILVKDIYEGLGDLVLNSQIERIQFFTIQELRPRKIKVVQQE